MLGVALALVPIPAGWMSDRIGRKPLVVASAICSAAGTGILLVARDVPMLYLAGAVAGLGVGTFLAANWAMILDIIPPSEAARYLGLANIATAGGSALGRLIGGALIAPINAAAHSPAAGYLAVYAIAGLCVLAAGAVVLPLGPPRRAAEPGLPAAGGGIGT